MSFMFVGEFGLAGARNGESQHGGAYTAYLRWGAAANLYSHAPGLVSAFCQQRDLSEGGQND